LPDINQVARNATDPGIAATFFIGEENRTQKIPVHFSEFRGSSVHKIFIFAHQAFAQSISQSKSGPMKKPKFFAAVFLLFLLFPGVFSQQLPKSGHPFRLVSYNIRYDNPNDGDNTWANRSERVANLLRFHKANIFCLQEALLNQIEDLQAEFPEFEYYGVGRDDGKIKGEFCPVFYDAGRFEKTDYGTFWLSETPKKPGSTGWFATLPRITSWVKFRDKATGNLFFVFNTHLDHASETARDKGSELIMQKITEICNGLPVILCGDFNAKPGTEPYNNVVNNGKQNIQMFDARMAAESPHHGPPLHLLAGISQECPEISSTTFL